MIVDRLHTGPRDGGLLDTTIPRINWATHRIATAVKGGFFVDFLGALRKQLTHKRRGLLDAAGAVGSA
jgi:hypothetical protein